MSDSEKFMPTLIIVGIIISVYIYTSFIGGNFLYTTSEMIYRFGQVNRFVIYGGLYYQIFTSIFIHGNIAHLFGNMLFLYIFGLRAEEFFSIFEYLIIFFLGGLTGNLLSLILLPLDLPSVGASGAIFAIFGAATIYARRTVSQSIMGAVIYAFFLVFLSSGPNVNNFAHIGGLITGLIIGYILSLRHSKRIKYSISYSY